MVKLKLFLISLNLKIEIEDITVIPGLENRNNNQLSNFGVNFFSKYKSILKPLGNYYAGLSNYT